MELSRYIFSDAYILEELRREYHISNAKGRIRLLRKLYNDDRAAPFEIACLAVEDQYVEVRQWIARHGRYLDYNNDEPSRPNLADRLKNDTDPFVRACLRENPTVFDAWSSTAWVEYFQEATHLERLALMRNPEVGSAHGEDLIQQIFNHEDQELGIDLEARKELILAFLTNTKALNESRRLKRLHFQDGLSWAGTRAHFSRLWTLISKWPKGTGNLQFSTRSTDM